MFGAPKPKYYGLRSDICLQFIFEGCGSVLTKIGRCLVILKTEIERSTANFVEFVVITRLNYFFCICCVSNMEMNSEFGNLKAGDVILMEFEMEFCKIFC